MACRGGGAAVGLWAVVWGASFADQAGGDWVGWIPRTSPTTFARAVSGQITDVEPLAWLVLAAVVAGAWCLGRVPTAGFAHVWLAVGAVPFVAAAAIGLVSPFLIDRAVTVASWAPPLALGSLAAALVARWSLAGRAFTLALVAVVSIGTVTFLAGKRYDADLAIDHLDAVAQPGDVIVTARRGTRRFRRTGSGSSSGGTPSGSGPRASTARRRSGRVTHRRPVGSVVHAGVVRLGFPGYRACPEAADGSTAPWSDGLTHVVCLERSQ